MGYRIPERTARISFAGTDYDGAEVVVSLNVKIGVYREMVAAHDARDFDAVIAMLCGVIREWNLEDGDGAIPVTPEGFDRIDDLGFLRALLSGWQGAIDGETAVPAPLGVPSSNGSTSTGETLSASPSGSSAI